MFLHHEPRVPHISPGFGEMWELTNAGAREPVAPENFPSESSNSHVSPPVNGTALITATIVSPAFQQVPSCRFQSPLDRSIRPGDGLPLPGKE